MAASTADSQTLSSRSRSSSPPTIAVCTDVWNFVFVDVETKKKDRRGEAAATTAAITAADIDITTWSAGDRRMLMSSDRVQTFVGDRVVTKISKFILRATSETATDIIKDGKVHLPAGTDVNGVVQLVNWLEGIVSGPFKPINRNMTMTTSLNVCTAGGLLGMHKYVDPLHRRCKAKLCKKSPEHSDMDAIIECKTSHPRLYKVLVNNLAIHVDKGDIANPDNFAAYLAKNPTLETAIFTANEQYHEALRIEAEVKERRAQKAAKAEAKKQQTDENTASFAAKAKKDAALNKSCQVKKRASGKATLFTNEERIWYMRNNGGKLPKGC